MKGVVFTVDRRMYVKDFAEPLRVAAFSRLGGRSLSRRPHWNRTGCRNFDFIWRKRK